MLSFLVWLEFSWTEITSKPPSRMLWFVSYFFYLFIFQIPPLEKNHVVVSPEGKLIALIATSDEIRNLFSKYMSDIAAIRHKLNQVQMRANPVRRAFVGQVCAHGIRTCYESTISFFIFKI